MDPTISADISNVKVEIHRLDGYQSTIHRLDGYPQVVYFIDIFPRRIDGSYLAQNLAVAKFFVAKHIVCRGSKHPNPIKPSTETH